MIAVTREAIRLLNDGSQVLSEIEHNGVRVNLEYLEETQKKTDEEIRRLESEMRSDLVYREIRRRYGERASISSREQIGDILFTRMGFESKGKTTTGRASMRKEDLDDIDHPFVENFLKVEGLKKIRDTYFVGTRREMVKQGSFYFIHPTYNLHTVSTFRSSSDHPNFQNFPKRNPELASLIRPCFLPHKGHHMVEIDFSQIEVRVAACYTKDPVLEKYVRDPSTDMHGDTAEQLFLLKKDQVHKKTTRDSAKNQWVFPQFYGSTYQNCAKNIWKAARMRDFKVGGDGISIFDHLKSKGITERGDCVYGQDPIPGTFEEHCRKIERDFWQRRFKVYTNWKKTWHEAYQRHGGFRMFTGFAVNGVFAKNDVNNYPIQGSSFHCLLWCLIELWKWMKANKMKSKIIGEIHDSALLSVHPSELQDVISKMYSLMTEALLDEWTWITVPLEAEVDVGPVDSDWTTCRLWKCESGVWSAA